MNENRIFNILVLDGGGSKGMYSIGVLKELELQLGRPLCNCFDLIYGTSTGSIIAALIALGYETPKIEELYLNIVPTIMKPKSKKGKSKAICQAANSIFEDKKFDSFQTNIGIVALNYETQMPLIFKSDIQQTHGMKQSFKSGFGCTIAEAVQCSCAAYPLFDKMDIVTDSHGSIEVVDGGFIANNPTLYAMIDAYKALEIEKHNIRLLNVGVGSYVERSTGFISNALKRIEFFQFIERVLSANTNSNTLITKLLFPNLQMLRISDAFPEPKYGTNMLEYDHEKLHKMLQLGRGSYAKYESEIVKLLGIR